MSTNSKTCGMTKISVVLLLFALPTVAWAGALTVTVIGVASPQDVAGGKAELRTRALENAREAALWHAESEVSQKQNERQYEGSINGKETTDSSYDRTTRATGRHVVRLVKVLEEGTRGEDYFVRAVWEITPESEVPINLGFIWKNIGRPGVFLSLTETRNGHTTSENRQMHDYLRGNLTKQGIALQPDETADAFRIHASQSADVEQNYVSGVRVYTARCRVGFNVRQPLQKEISVQRSYSQEREPGFDGTKAVDSCYQKIAPQLAKSLIRNLGKLMRNVWKEGKLFYVVVKKIDRNAERIIKSLMRRNIDGEPPRFLEYSHEEITWQIVFDGDAEKLAAMLSQTFQNSGIAMNLEQIRGGRVVFSYGG